MNKYAVAIYDIESEQNEVSIAKGADGLGAMYYAMLNFLNTEMIRGVIEEVDKKEYLNELINLTTEQDFIKKCREYGWILDYPLEI